MEPTRIYDAALSLADDERADLAYKLLQSLKPPSILSADTPELEGEVERRIAAYEAGEASADDWDNTSARLRRALQDEDSRGNYCRIYVAAALRDAAWPAAERRAYKQITTLISSQALSGPNETSHSARSNFAG
jgi:putative addiction module component (TIGR02574 family)